MLKLEKVIDSPNSSEHLYIICKLKNGAQHGLRNGKFKISKCNWLHLGQPHGYGEYVIDGTVIEPYSVIRDLGILIDSKLKFHDQATTVAKKANRLLAVIHKTFQYFDHNTFISLYKSYI